MSQLAPMPTGFTSVIATRTFACICDGVTSTLVVEVGMPIQDVETITGFDWRCPIRLAQATAVHERSVCGVDSVQALHLALRLVHDEVERMRTSKNCRILLFDAPYDGTI